MIQPEEGSYPPERVVMVRFEHQRAKSEWADRDPAVTSARLAKSLVRKGRASEKTLPSLTDAVGRAMILNPRLTVARMRDDSSVIDRMKALGAMEEEAARAFEDGTRATITEESTFEAVRRFISSQGEEGVVWPRLENEGSLGLATLSFPKGMAALRDGLMHALSGRHGCIVVSEGDTATEAFHLVTWSATPKSHVLAAADMIARDLPPFILSRRIGSLHPLAWAVLQATWNPNGPRALEGPGPLRRRDAATRRLRDYRDGWKAAANVRTAFLYDRHNDLFRAIEKGVARLPEALPSEAVLSEVMAYVEADAPNMDGYVRHLENLIETGPMLSKLR